MPPNPCTAPPPHSTVYCSESPTAMDTVVAANPNTMQQALRECSRTAAGPYISGMIVTKSAKSMAVPANDNANMDMLSKEEETYAPRIAAGISTMPDEKKKGVTRKRARL